MVETWLAGGGGAIERLTESLKRKVSRNALKSLISGSVTWFSFSA
ncbi:hypothetical protein RD1_1667 [Roseobacter denitrificans OCh 114]|uniref:Uncharacterized protein n=1 Tax=Roseobacter denitrificans (strain ATCC 33942 / OCh 114) TaxID=375451 RepID=Q169Q1_ROSDO|nr:hypothetical protein RD1_1667 [Roseobacter denitrificans OCh 114]